MKLQQGDVILESIDYNIQGEKLNHLVLAEGEVTGHSHQLVNGLGQLIMMDKIMYLQVFSETALLRHEEHRPISIPKGNWKVKIIREYDPFDDEIRRVQD